MQVEKTLITSPRDTESEYLNMRKDADSYMLIASCGTTGNP